MNSERQKREEEIERLMRGAGPSRESDIAFQEEVRKAASAIIEEDATRIEKNEPAERGKQTINPATAGLWLLVLGAGLTFSIPILGATLIVCGIAGIVWAAFLRASNKKKSSRESIGT
jgi:hypothetical protein